MTLSLSGTIFSTMSATSRRTEIPRCLSAIVNAFKSKINMNLEQMTTASNKGGWLIFKGWGLISKEEVIDL